MLVVPNATLLLDLTAFKTAELDGGDLKLFVNDIVPDQNTVIGDLTEATFGGYAPITVATWGDPFLNINGLYEIVMPSQQFNASGSAGAELVYGFYFCEPGGALRLVGRFDSGPVPMGSATDALVVQLRLLSPLAGSEATISSVSA